MEKMMPVNIVKLFEKMTKFLIVTIGPLHY